MTAQKPAPDQDPVLKLLRLKRYETPSADYFERFIEEFHRRQSAALVRRPIWRLALDRISARLIDPAAGLAPAGRALAGAAAAVAILAAGAASVAVKPWQEGAGGRFAALFQQGRAEAQPAGGGRPGPGLLSEVNRLSLDPNLDRIFLEEALRDRPASGFPAASPVSQPRGPGGDSGPRRAVSAPRYVIDARPVSHESPVLSF